jgi:hypothetical protein
MTDQSEKGRRDFLRSTVVASAAAATALTTFAGEDFPLAAEVPAYQETDCCETYKNIGKLYSNPEQPWIQKVNIFARLQYQYGYVDGQAGGNDDFNYDTDEFRRVYAGGSVNFLRHFLVSGQANIFRDDKPSGGDHRGFEFQNMWDFYVKFDVQQAFGIDVLDALQLGYGGREVNMSAEWNVSSKKIKTVERSALANKIWPNDLEKSNPTGIWVEGEKGNLGWTAGAFSTTQDDWLAEWNDGQLYYLKFPYELKEITGADVSKLLWTGFYQDVDQGEEALAGGVEWATSLSMRYGLGPWEVLVEGIYGGNGDTDGDGERKADNQQGDFSGIVLFPTYWLVKDRLDAVARCQYAMSDEDQGVRLYSRYVLRADVDSDLDLPNGGRGDKHHSFYAGTNYYFCGDNAKIMLGIQYDDMSSSGDDVYSGWTTFLAFRTFF